MSECRIVVVDKGKMHVGTGYYKAVYQWIALIPGSRGFEDLRKKRFTERPGETYALICGVAVLVGHLWPVWYRFVGGGGNSSVIGMVLAIACFNLLRCGLPASCVRAIQLPVSGVMSL